MDEDNSIASQVIFGHLESTVAVRCLARNDMGVVSREVKLVSNGKMPAILHDCYFHLRTKYNFKWIL